MKVLDVSRGDSVGEIVDFEWCPGVKEPQWAAAVEFESGEVDLYYFRELPRLVIDAEAYQDDEIILAYEEGEDEFEQPGDEERNEIAAMDAVLEEDV